MNLVEILASVKGTAYDNKVRTQLDLDEVE